MSTQELAASAHQLWLRGLQSEDDVFSDCSDEAVQCMRKVTSCT